MYRCWRWHSRSILFISICSFHSYVCKIFQNMMFQNIIVSSLYHWLRVWEVFLLNNLGISFSLLPSPYFILKIFMFFKYAKYWAIGNILFPLVHTNWMPFYSNHHLYLILCRFYSNQTAWFTFVPFSMPSIIFVFILTSNMNEKTFPQ